MLGYKGGLSAPGLGPHDSLRSSISQHENDNLSKKRTMLLPQLSSDQTTQ